MACFCRVTGKEVLELSQRYAHVRFHLMLAPLSTIILRESVSESHSNVLHKFVDRTDTPMLGTRAGFTVCMLSRVSAACDFGSYGESRWEDFDRRYDQTDSRNEFKAILITRKYVYKPEKLLCYTRNNYEAKHQSRIVVVY